MSSTETYVHLQENFIKTELETGRKMLRQALRQRRMRQNERAMDSWRMARLALSGAETHMAAVGLPREVVTRMNRGAAQLRRLIAAFEHLG